MGNTYIPAKMPEITVTFEYTPSQVGDWEQPGYTDEVYIEDVKINGLPISKELDQLLMDVYSDFWENDIKNNIKKRNDCEGD